MKKEYDFSNARPNPYAKKLKSQITINLDVETIDYFKEQAATCGIPYQTLINLYLGDCAKKTETTIGLELKTTTPPKSLWAASSYHSVKELET